MVPTSLKLSNFTSYGENPPELDFTKFHMAAISGPNGAGKSSLLDAITWCLWGTSRAGDSSDALIRLGQNEMWVDFSFQLDKHVFTVKRRRIKKGGGSTALEFWSNSHNLTEGTIKSTQQKIIDTLHLSFETFTNSSFLRQNHADEFTTKGATDRKRILADILGLDHYDALEEKAKERAKAAQTRMQTLDFSLIEMDRELMQSEDSQEKKKEAEGKISELEKSIQEMETRLKSLQEEKAKLNALHEQQQKIRQTLSDLEQEFSQILAQGKQKAQTIKELEEALLELPGFDEKIATLKLLQKQLEDYNRIKQERLQLEKELLETQGKINVKNEQKNTLEQKLKELAREILGLEKAGAKCPTCGQEVGKDQKHKIKEALFLEEKSLKEDLAKIDTRELEKDLESTRKKHDTLSLDEGQYQEILKKLSDLEKLQDRREELVKKQATLESEKKTVEDLRKLFAGKKEQVEKLKKEADGFSDMTKTLEDLEGKIITQTSELASLRTQEKEARSLLGQAMELISRVEQVKKRKEEFEKQKEELLREKEAFEELSLAFGKKGIQAMIIETAIPEIEDEANALLDKLTEGRMKVSFDTQRETKTKVASIDGKKDFAMVETLDIIISDEMGEREYSLYSGGEVFRVNLAIRLAISKLLTHRAGAKLQFLVIDEGFGTQDAPGRSRLIEVLDTIKNDYEKILIITHLEELKEEFPTRIEVSKGTTGSTFEIINN